MRQVDVDPADATVGAWQDGRAGRGERQGSRHRGRTHGRGGEGRRGCIGRRWRNGWGWGWGWSRGRGRRGCGGRRARASRRWRVGHPGSRPGYRCRRGRCGGQRGESRQVLQQGTGQKAADDAKRDDEQGQAGRDGQTLPPTVRRGRPASRRRRGLLPGDRSCHTLAGPVQSSSSTGVVGVAGQGPGNIGQTGTGVVAEPRHPEESGHVGRVEDQGSTKPAPCFGPLSRTSRGPALPQKHDDPIFHSQPTNSQGGPSPSRKQMRPSTMP